MPNDQNDNPFGLPAALAPKQEPFALPGFQRIDNKGFPKVQGLSRATFALIFPPDREAVLRRAAVLHFAHQVEINEAVQMAVEENETLQILDGYSLLAQFYNLLAPEFPGGKLINDRINPHALRYARAVTTAADKWREILSATEQGVAAWIAAGIMPIDGACVMSGKPLRSWSSDNPDTFALPEYADQFAATGRTLISLIISESARRKEVAEEFVPIDWEAELETAE